MGDVESHAVRISEKEKPERENIPHGDCEEYLDYESATSLRKWRKQITAAANSKKKEEHIPNLDFKKDKITGSLWA